MSYQKSFDLLSAFLDNKYKGPKYKNVSCKDDDFDKSMKYWFGDGRVISLDDNVIEYWVASREAIARYLDD